MAVQTTWDRIRNVQTANPTWSVLLDAGNISAANHDFNIYADDPAIGTHALRVRVNAGTPNVDVESLAAGTKNLGVATNPWTNVQTQNLALVGTSSGVLTLKAPAVVTSYTATWPTAVGAANTVLADTAGSGMLSWATLAGLGGVTGSGAANRVTYWTGSNTISGAANFQFDGTNVRAAVGLQVGGTAESLATGTLFVGEAHGTPVAGARVIFGETVTTAESAEPYIQQSSDGHFVAAGVVQDLGLYAPSTGGSIVFYTTGIARWAVRGSSQGHLLPIATNTYDIGSTTLAVRAVYTRALQPDTGQTLSLNRSGGSTWASLTTGATNIGISTVFLDNVIFQLGTGGADSALDWSTAQTNDGIVWATTVNSSSGSGNFVFTAFANRDTNHAYVVSPDPRLYLASATTPGTNWWSIHHDATNARYGRGAGVHVFDSTIRTTPGTVSLPAYSFDGDEDTGMYRVGTNLLGFATTGLVRWTIDSLGDLSPGITATYDIGTTILAVADIHTTRLLFKGTTAGLLTMAVPTTVTSYTVTWPSAQASGAQFLRNNGAGVLSWATVLVPSDIGSTVQAFDVVLEDLAALSVVADNEFIVGTGAGVYAHESGATARTSLGVAIGSDVQAWGAALDDLSALGAPGSADLFIVSTGIGVFAYESGATARTSMGAAATVHSHAASDITSGTMAVARGGTNIGSYTIGDILYASAAGVLSKLAAGTATYALTSNGAGVAPSWQAIPSGVGTSGTPVNNQVAIFTDANTIEGVSALTWDGTILNADGGLLVNAAGADRDSRIAGDTLTHMLYLEGNAASENIALLAAGLPSWNSGDRIMFLGGMTTEPIGNPSGGCYLWFNTSSNKLKARLPNGDIIEIAGPV
jgi:hypothetical protein